MAPTVYIVAGPTAVGKTAVAIALAQRLGTDIVSADSRQCYQGMAIGSAQPSPAELRAVRHYFINEFPVTRSLTAADYESLAMGYLDDIFTRHDTAVVCGGTGLYIKALCEGLDEMPQMDPAIVAAVEEGYKLHGLAWLQEAIQKEDPEFYATGETLNPARLTRALSFARSSGSSITAYRTRQKKQRPFNIVKIGLDLPRQELYARVDQRVDAMMNEGLLEEVKALTPHKHLKNLRTVGYAELFDYLDGIYTLEEAVNKIKQHTRNYAKRQLTWFRKDEDMIWRFPGDKDLIKKLPLENGSLRDVINKKQNP